MSSRTLHSQQASSLAPHPPTHLSSQAFAWLARSKHTLRHMNEARHIFVVLRLLELRNRWLSSPGTSRGVNSSKTYASTGGL